MEVCMGRRHFSDRWIRNLKPVPDAGKKITPEPPPGERKRIARPEWTDTEVPGLALRITGRKTFVFIARYPGNKNGNPARRTLGFYDEMSLAEAREEARRWRKLINDGKDPADERRRQIEAEARARDNTVDAVLAQLVADRTDLRTIDDIERNIKKLGWGDRPIGDITWGDIKAVVDATKDRGRKSQARHIFAYCRVLFNYAREQGYITISPCDYKKPSKLIGEHVPRDRTLNDDEVRAIWAAAGQMGAIGAIVRVLLLTGQRRNEVAQMRWSEVDRANHLWVIPAARYKSKVEHSVPLSPEVREILDALPRRGDYVFSDGPISDSTISQGKRLLDKACGVSKWVLHDLRRTCRTNLSRLKVQDSIAELVLGHRQPSLVRTYNRYTFLDERRDALEAWAQRLRGIVSEAPRDVA
jgi:integrase